MPFFMTQFSYTADAWKTLAKNPEDREAPVRALCEKLGGRLVCLYYSFGDHDGFIVTEMPDSQTAGVAVLAAGLPGHLKGTRTTQLFTMAEAMEMMGKAGAIAYPAPEG